MAQLQAMDRAMKINQIPSRGVLQNFFWLVGDKALRLVVGLATSIVIARYLGPEKFGVLNYVLVFSGFFYVLCTLGLDRVVVKELVAEPQNSSSILGSSFVLRLFAAVVSLPLAVIIQWLSGGGGDVVVYVAIALVGAGFQSLDVIDFYYQSRSESRKTVLIKNATYLLVGGAKVALALFSANLVWFVVLVSIEYAAGGLALLFFFGKKVKHRPWFKFDRKMALAMFSESFVNFVGLLAFFAAIRVDQIILLHLLDAHQYGLYSTAIRLYEMPLFMTLAVVTSVYPKMVEMFAVDAAAFNALYLRVTSMLTWVAIGMVVVAQFLVPLLLPLFFGQSYAGVVPVLQILSLGWVFCFNGALRAAYLAIIRKQRYLLIYQLGGLLANIALVFVLTRLFGLSGAAIATVISLGLMLFVFNVLARDTRSILVWQLKALSPFFILKR